MFGGGSIQQPSDEEVGGEEFIEQPTSIWSVSGSAQITTRPTRPPAPTEEEDPYLFTGGATVTKCFDHNTGRSFRCPTGFSDGSTLITTTNTDGSVAYKEVVVSGDTGASLTRGCTDPNASNYDPSASKNDMSCVYSVTMDRPGVYGSGSKEISMQDIYKNYRYVTCPPHPGRKFELRPGEQYISANTIMIWDSDTAAAAKTVTTAEYCALRRSEPRPPACVYSSAENYKLFGAVDLTQLLVEWGLPPLPSLDQTVCDADKEQILDDVINMLSRLAGDTIDLDFEDPDFTTVMNGVKYAALSLHGNWADLVAACIEFGRGNFGESILELLEAIPGFGNTIGKVIDKTGLGFILRKVMNKIPDSWKDVIIDAALEALQLATAVTSPSIVTVPLLTLVQSAIMFGKKDWDESVANILMMGMGQIVDRLAGPLMKSKAVLGPVTAGGLKPVAAFNPGAKGMEKITQSIKVIVEPIVDALKAPLIKLGRKYGFLDAVGNPTAMGASAQQKAKDALEAAKKAYAIQSGIGDVNDSYGANFGPDNNYGFSYT